MCQNLILQKYACSSIIIIHQFIHPSTISIIIHPSIHPSIHHRPFPLAMQTPTTTPYGPGVRALPLLLWSVWFFRELSSVARLTPPPSFPFVSLSLSLSLSLFIFFSFSLLLPGTILTL
jgi:hypothetical protein